MATDVKQTIEGIANLTGLTWRTVKSRLLGKVDAVERVGKRDFYDTRQALPLVFSVDETSLEAERIRKTQADADLTETRNDQLRRQLVPREEVLATVGEWSALVRRAIENSAMSQAEKQAALDIITEADIARESEYEPLD